MKQRIETYSSEKVRGDTKAFFSGVCILSFSTVLVKILGLASKIPLIDRLGAEGMGYFNSAYELYAMLCVLSTAGLPTALSMLISVEDRLTDTGRTRIRQIYRSASVLFCVIGVVGAAVLFFFADSLANAIGSPQAKWCIMAIAPSLLFVCIVGAIRGYFQGLRNMAPTAVSQLLEAGGKLLFGVLFADLALSRGADLSVAAASAVLGFSIGCLISAVYLFIRKGVDALRQRHRSVDQENKSRPGILRGLLKIALPITISSAVISVTRLIDMTVMIRKLQDIGMSIAESNRIYGAYTTLALPVFSLLPSLIAPISMALIPQLNAAIGRGSHEGQRASIETSLRLTVLLSMPASFGIIAFASPLLNLLFSGEPEAVEICSPLLSVLGMSVLFSCLITTTNAILQSYRKVGLPILSMGIGVVIKLLLANVLIGIPSLGALGAPISTFCCDVTVTALNLFFIYKYTKEIQADVPRALARPLIPSVLAVLAAYATFTLLYVRLGSDISLLLAIFIAILLYFVFAFLIGAIQREDLQLLPFVGSKIQKTRKKRSP